MRLTMVALPLALLFAPVRQVVDARMSLVMLLEFPALLAAGWAVASVMPTGVLRRLGAFNAIGLVSAMAVLLVFSYWMIPAALDEALLSSGVYLARQVSWLAAGATLALPRPGSRPGVDLFFVGNLAWMAASAGLLYRDADSRLCVNYLLQDQRTAGDGLIFFAFAAFGAWVWRFRNELLDDKALPARGVQGPLDEANNIG